MSNIGLDGGAFLGSAPQPFFVNDVDGQMSGSINEIATALSKAQEELDAAKKDNSGYGYNYSDLATVIASAKPILAKNGLSVTQLVGDVGDNVSVTTILSHTSGQWFRSNASIPLIEMKGCNKAQCAGASLSYLRRYAYQAIIGQPSEDNDASSNGYSKSDSPKKKVGASPKKASGDLANKKKPGFLRAKPVNNGDDDDDI